MRTQSRKFESVVQLGLFIIIFVLLLLNVCSNYVIYHVWEGKRTQAALAGFDLLRCEDVERRRGSLHWHVLATLVSKGSTGVS